MSAQVGIFERDRRRCLAARGFDLGGVARWALLALAFTAFGGVLGLAILELPVVGFSAMGEFAWTLCGIVTAFCVALTLYYAHLIFGRLQCSLLEFCVIVILLGTLEGLVVSTPGILHVPGLLVVLAAALPAVVFHAAAEGLVEARLLDVTDPFKRLLILLANIIGLAGVAAVATGPSLVLAGLVRFAEHGSLSLLGWGFLTLVLGAAVIVPGAIVGRKAKNAARKILGEIQEAPPRKQTT